MLRDFTSSGSSKKSSFLKKKTFLFSLNTCETGSAVPSRVSLPISMYMYVWSQLQAKSSAYEIPPEFHGDVHLLLVHIMYYECSSTYMYILLCKMISAAALLSCSVSSTNECPHIK